MTILFVGFSGAFAGIPGTGISGDSIEELADRPRL